MIPVISPAAAWSAARMSTSFIGLWACRNQDEGT